MILSRGGSAQVWISQYEKNSIFPDFFRRPCRLHAEVGVTNVASLSSEWSVSPLAGGKRWQQCGSIAWLSWACSMREFASGRGQG